MKKKHKKKVLKHGVLNSPLVMSLIRLIPTILLLIGVLVGIGNLSRLISKEKRVLGTEGSLPYMRTETIEARVAELREMYEETGSEKIRKEIDRLLGF